MGNEKMQLQIENKRKGVFVCVWWGSIKNVFVKFSNPYTYLLFETGTATCACLSLYATLQLCACNKNCYGHTCVIHRFQSL